MLGASDLQDPSPNFPATWVAAHEAAALALGKPLIVEELTRSLPPPPKKAALCSAEVHMFDSVRV